MDFQEKFFQHDGVSTKYLEKGSGEIFLFFIGGGVRVETFEKILNDLSSKYHVIAPDLPPFGNSTVPQEIWHLEDYGNFFLEFVKFLNIKNLTVAGFSFGGAVALALAAKSEEVKNLILVDSAGKSSGYSEIKFRYKYFVEKTFFDLFHYRDIPLFFLITKDFLANRIKKFFQRSHITKIIRNVLLKDFESFDKIKARTLILWGSQDEIFSPKLAQSMSKEIANSTLQFVNGNHDWSFFRRKELVDLIIQWLEKKEFAAGIKIQ